MFKKIQLSLLACFLSVALLGIVVFLFLAVPRVKDSALAEVEDQVRDKLLIVEPEIAASLTKGAGMPSLQRNAIRISRASGDRVTVIDAKGVVLADSATELGELADLENHLRRPEIADAARSGSGVAVRYSATTGEDLIYVAMRISDGAGKTTGFLRLSVPVTFAAVAAQKIQKALLAAFFASMLFAFILSFIFSKSFADPLVRLSAVAKKISGGQFPQHILRRSKFEVGELEKDVEDMSVKLSEMFALTSTDRTRVSAILSSMTDGVLAVDRWGRVILANPAMEKVFGIIELDVLGRTAREAVRNNEIADIVEEARNGLKGVTREISILVPIERSFIADATPIMDRAGVFQGVVCVLHDITELKRLEGYRSEFVANVSHELKTPLTAIKGYVETLLDGAIDDRARNREFLKRIDKHATGLSALIDDILEISHLESGKELPKFSRIDVSRTVARAVEDVHEKAKRKGLKLETKCSGENVQISGIEEHVYRAIKNVLDNAVNYTPSGGSVTVSCLAEEGSVIVSVEDTGIGIAPEHIPRIFERFYRVDKGRSRDMGGTGLGLAIVKHVMNIHNGSVSVESKEGSGSRFTLAFPVAEA